MALDPKIEQKILQLRQEAGALWRAKDVQGYITKMLEAWNQFPEPREKMTMSNVLAEEISETYLTDLKEYSKALEWADILQKYHETSGAADSGEGEFQKGKIYFAMGNMEEAQKQFRISFQKSEGSGWQDAPQEYIDLLKKK